MPGGGADGVRKMAGLFGASCAKDFEMPLEMVENCGGKWAVRKRASIAVAKARELILQGAGQVVEESGGNEGKGLFASVRPTERVLKLRDLIEGLLSDAAGDTSGEFCDDLQFM